VNPKTCGQTQYDKKKTVGYLEQDWSYNKEHPYGPHNWSHLYPSAGGKNQSPIDLTVDESKVALGLQPLELQYKPAPAKIINKGYTIEVQWQAGHFLAVDRQYYLQSFHFHTPAEHTFGGETNEMEMHLVHKDAAGNLAVIGIVFEIRGQNRHPFLAKFWNMIPQTPGTEADIGELSPDLLKITGKRYFTYSGSLTTPPCTEGVLWFVIQGVQNCSDDQVRLLRRFMNGIPNNRPIQPKHSHKLTCTEACW